MSRYLPPNTHGHTYQKQQTSRVRLFHCLHGCLNLLLTRMLYSGWFSLPPTHPAHLSPSLVALVNSFTLKTGKLLLLLLL